MSSTRLEALADDFMSGLSFRDAPHNAKKRLQIRKRPLGLVAGTTENINSGSRLDGYRLTAISRCSCRAKITLKVRQRCFHAIRLSDRLRLGSRPKEIAVPTATVGGRHEPSLSVLPLLPFKVGSLDLCSEPEWWIPRFQIFAKI